MKDTGKLNFSPATTESAVPANGTNTAMIIDAERHRGLLFSAPLRALYPSSRLLFIYVFVGRTNNREDSILAFPFISFIYST